MLANKVHRIPSKLSPAREKGIKKIGDSYIFSLTHVWIHLCSLLRCNKTGHFARECPEGEADEREVFTVDDMMMILPVAMTMTTFFGHV